MKTFFAGILLAVFIHGNANAMSNDEIKRLVRSVDASFVQGNIYHISYTFSETRPPAYYQYRRDLIKLMQKESARPPEDQDPKMSPEAFAQRQSLMARAVASATRGLDVPAQRTDTDEYSADGNGFFLERNRVVVRKDGKQLNFGPDITVSDGKVMGDFYSDKRATLQPATERPPMGIEWVGHAYQFGYTPISSHLNLYTNFQAAEQGDDLVISTQRMDPGNLKVELELTIDKATLLPKKMWSRCYNQVGLVSVQEIKTWQFQDIAGVRLPKVVVDQHYQLDFNEKLNLEHEETLTVTGYSVVPIDCKQALQDLLKKNYSVFDQISGTHYVSGDPGAALDQLSK
jgi:hypothetical protein